MSKINLKPIRRGDTWSIDFKFWEDSCKSTPINVSTYVFKLMAKNASGVTQWTWDNGLFVEGATTNERIITLSAVTTATYNVGEFAYDLQVTNASGTFTYINGYIRVQDQITS